jgi:uncharacterized protein YkwD
MQRRIGSTRFLAAGWLIVFAAGCDGGAIGVGQGPREGRWQGPELEFVVSDGEIRDLVVAPATCTGDDGCAMSYGGPIDGVALLALPFVFASPAASSPKQRVEGQFQSDLTAAGARYLGAEQACCRVVGAWTAQWVADLTPAGGRGGQGRGESALGSTDWGGASTGTLHPGPSQPLATTPAADLPPDEAQRAAAEHVNVIRATIGVAPARFDGAIAIAATAHAQFYVAHAASFQAAGLSAHSEDPAFGAGFTGKNFGARMKAAGFQGAAFAEVMAFTGGPITAVDGWMATLYHRLPIIDAAVDAYGYGQAKAGKATTEVMDLARGKAIIDPILVWPTPGATNVAKSWSGAESPQPKPPPLGYPSGPMITAHLPPGAKVVSHALFDSADASVGHVWLDATNDPTMAAYSSRAVALYAERPLAGDSVFRVRLSFEVAGKVEVLQWRFFTTP